MRPQLAGWANFYVIVGSSAGALIGLQFVVVALVSSIRTQTVSGAVRAFATPTIVYFSTVLVTSALMSIPHHTRSSLRAVLMMIGGAGLCYLIWVGTHMRRQDQYTPDFGDVTWFIMLPAASFATTFVAGILAQRATGAALVLAGAAALLLLLTGVHNSWDAAVYMVANSPAEHGE